MNKFINVDNDTFLDIRNILNGVFSPLKGFLGAKDYHSVVKKMHLTSGSPWTIPITLDVPKEQGKILVKEKRVALRYEDKIIAYLLPEDLFEVHYSQDISRIYGTKDGKHPGVNKEINRNPFRLGGEIIPADKIITASDHELTPKETIAIFKKLGFKTIVGFQTRNPIHRAHEYLQRVALELHDGLFIQPLLGWKKRGDFTPKAIIKSYEVMINKYYPKNRVVFGALTTAMRYAGPREAVFHALIRKNYGCTHFIVGRDHAGVGNYYGKYEAHNLCKSFNDLGIEILYMHGPYYSKKFGEIVTEQTCRAEAADSVDISGTLIREMIQKGKCPPKEYMRADVAKVLIELEKKGEAFIL